MDTVDSNTIGISIIIPVYGVEKYIKKFMTSLAHQTITNFRAIFIDDKSQDNSISIIENYKSGIKGEFVLIRNRENIGLSRSRNEGLAYVRNHPTEYVTFLDPDDWIEEDYLEDLYYTARKDNLDLCISGVVRFNESDGRSICTEMVNMKGGVFNVEECDFLAVINPCSYSKLFRFEPIKDVTFRDIKRSEDTCYLFECLKNYKRVEFTRNAKYHYCVRGNSLTGKIGEDKYVSMHEGFVELLDVFGESEYLKLRQMLVSQIFIHSSIGGVCRICFSDMKRCLLMERRERNFLNENIPEWKNNPFLDFFTVKFCNRKILGLKFCAALYKCHMFVMFIISYYFFSRVLGKEIRA